MAPTLSPNPMPGAVTRGQPLALAAIAAMVVGPAPHAVLLSGPASSGKTTLAEDLAAGLLCNDPDPKARPCRRCRGCRLMASGNHPDLHRLAPEGPGGQIRIGDAASPEPGTVRHLVGELALLSMEGGARVAIVEKADRLNDGAQNALLKMLEEPPAGVSIVLCADREECLLPTVMSRCVRVRLGAVDGREIERWLGERGLADAPSAARVARLAAGAPGLALAYARAPESVRLRGEIARGLIDLLAAGRNERLVQIRTLMSSAAALEAALREGARTGDGTADDATPQPARGKRRKAAATVEGADDAGESGAATAKVSAADRRAAAASLLGIWAALARDLIVAGLGEPRQVRDPDLLDELVVAGPTVDRSSLTTFLALLASTESRLADNLSPELALDVMALAWPRPGRAA